MAQREPATEGSDFGRILAFTDGVFAIAITLLVLGFDDPSGPDVARRVLDQWPQLLAYLLSFAVVGRMWLVHHRFFATLHRFDRLLLVLNLAYLAAVVLVPYTSELLGDHGGETVAAVLYAVVLAIATLLQWAMVRHTLRAKHVRDELRARVAPFGGPRALFAPALLLVSIPVAFANPHVAEVMWIMLVVPALPRARET
ncbi:MAG TPA: TMEM175 family protein [Thermoleophilaceae bacterium]|nr:TMEM175 family protein [Thermoleophilaceae bacterium]